MPLLGQVPGLGCPFDGHRDVDRKSELVMFLRARLLEHRGADPVHAELCRRFGGERRALPMPDFSR